MKGRNIRTKNWVEESSIFKRRGPLLDEDLKFCSSHIDERPLENLECLVLENDYPCPHAQVSRVKRVNDYTKGVGHKIGVSMNLLISATRTINS